jgi:hypothetical protein
MKRTAWRPRSYAGLSRCPWMMADLFGSGANLEAEILARSEKGTL